jgi:hypothetical protein
LLLSDWLNADIELGVADGVADGVGVGVAVGVDVLVQADTMTMPAMAITAMPKSAKDFLSKLFTACPSARLVYNSFISYEFICS